MEFRRVLIIRWFKEGEIAHGGEAIGGMATAPAANLSPSATVIRISMHNLPNSFQGPLFFSSAEHVVCETLKFRCRAQS